MAGALQVRCSPMIIGSFRWLLVSLAGAAVVGGPIASGARMTVPACSADHLSGVFVNSEGGAGSVTAEYGFKNDSAGGCTLKGYPTVQMLAKAGGKLATSESHATGGELGVKLTTVVLAHNGVAYFGVHYAAGTGYGADKCPTSAALALIAPGTASSQTIIAQVVRGAGGAIQPYGGTIEHLHCGEVLVTPVTGKRFQ